MKKIQLLQLVLLSLVLGLFFSYGCSSGGGGHDEEAPPNVSAQNTTVSISISDADSGSLVNQAITATIMGDAQPFAVDGANTATSVFQVTNGILTFYLKDTVPDPVEAIVLLESAGYISSSMNMSISKNAVTSLDTNMISTSTAANVEGVEIKTGTETADEITGELAAEIVVETQQETTTKATAKISVPATTIIKDAANNPLTGTLTTTVTYFNNADEESLNLFPGGLTAAVVVGTTEPTAMVTAGYSSIEVKDASGKTAATLDKPATITITVPKETINPVTGQLVNPGNDTFSIYSYSSSTGKWTLEGTGTYLNNDANGNYLVSLEVNHLSVWTVAWPKGLWHDSAFKCQAFTAATVTARDEALHGIKGLNLSVTTQGFTFNSKDNGVQTDANGEMVIQNILNRTVTINAYQNGVLKGTLEDNLCTNGYAYITVSDIDTTHTHTVTTKHKCGTSAATNLSATVTFKKGTTTKSVTTNSSGTSSIDLSNGQWTVISSYPLANQNVQAVNTVITINDNTRVDILFTLDKCAATTGATGSGSGTGVEG